MLLDRLLGGAGLAAPGGIATGKRNGGGSGISVGSLARRSTPYRAEMTAVRGESRCVPFAVTTSLKLS